MKVYLLLLAVMLLAWSNTFSQVDTVKLKKSETEKKTLIVTDRPPQAVYFGLGGSGLIFSGNYDRRFGKRLNGPGFATGLGLFFGGGLTVFTVPVSLNYLAGRKNHFFELAGGTTFVTGTIDWGDGWGSESGSGFIWHINAGYRYQPAAGGFFFRAGFCPLFAQGEGVMSYYLGGGVAF
jgi:hypothetical protein